jgi:hypothetical protein
MLTDQTVVSTRKGSYCTVFGIDQHRFCARTKDEKELWLRAVSNIKVKLMFDAPDPTSEDLAVFRAAVLERIVKLESLGAAAPEDGEGSPRNVESWDPLLPQVPRPPMPQSPRGDIWNPEPLEDAETVEPLVRKLEEMNAGDDEDENLGERRVDLDTTEPMEPDDCRKLLAGVNPVVGIKSDMPLSCTAIDSGIIASEQPGNIRTVHTTEKVLVSQNPPECSLPQEVCDVGCFSDLQQASGYSTAAAKGAKSLEAEEPQHHNIPLLMWSPGRRQQRQRAV